MYYSPGSGTGFRAATSTDGLAWTADSELIVVPETFSARLIGLPRVVRSAGTWIMTFEGMREYSFALYQASSEDGLWWKPLRGGEPIYVPDPSGWDRLAQANPSLHLTPGGAVILYNGCREPNAWDVGALVAEDPFGEWSSAGAPLVERGAPGSWDAGRLEGARPVHGGLLYFGLPGADSYAGGAIGYAALLSR